MNKLKVMQWIYELDEEIKKVDKNSTFDEIFLEELDVERGFEILIESLKFTTQNNFDDGCLEESEFYRKIMIKTIDFVRRNKKYITFTRYRCEECGEIIFELCDCCNK